MVGAVVMIVTIFVVTVITNGGETTQITSFAKEVTATQGDLTLGVNGSGVTTIDSTEQLLNILYGDSGLTLSVEEVYVTSKDEVNEGDSILKLSTSQLDELIAYYTKKITTTTNSYEKAKLEYEKNMAEAKLDYENNLALEDTSALEYQANVQELQNAVNQAKEKLEKADQKIEQYTSDLESDTYYTTYKVATYKKSVTTLEKTLSTLQTSFQKTKSNYTSKKSTYEKNITKLETTVKSNQSKCDTARTAYQEAMEAMFEHSSNTTSIDSNVVKEFQTKYQEYETAQSTLTKSEHSLQEENDKLTQLEQTYQTASKELQSTKQELTQAQKDYDSALNNYDKAVEDAKSQLTSLKKNYSTLEDNYQSALRNQQTNLITLSKEYDTDLLTSQNASMTYQQAIDNLSADVTTYEIELQELKDAKNALTTIRNNDGVVVASQSGTIATVNYEKDDMLSEQPSIVTYDNAGTVLVSFSVSQEDIASIHVGDTAKVSLSESARSNYQGTVTRIDTSPQTTGSVSNVTYLVTVSVEDSTGKLSVGSSVTVYIEQDTLEQVIYVPRNAVSTNGTKSYVTVKNEDGTTSQVNVTVGEDNGSYIEIKEGLTAGDTCVIAENEEETQTNQMNNKSTKE